MLKFYMELTSLNEFSEYQSDAVQEIVTKPPHWLVRFGTSLFFVLIALLATGTWWIRYPDVVKSQFILTVNDAPRKIVTRTEGKLTALLVKNGTKVRKGQMLGFLESTADPRQVLDMEVKVSKLSQHVSRSEWSSVYSFESYSYSELGELQNDFQIFVQQLNELKAYLPNGVFAKKMQIIAADQLDLQSMHKILEEQLSLQEKDYQLALDEFDMHSRLFGNKVISELDYKREKAKVLSREMPVKNLQASLVQSRVSQLAKRRELLELENLINERRSLFVQTVNSLRSSVQNWKKRYILTAPVMGKVSFLAPWQVEQYFEQGQEIMVVEPLGGTFQGLVKLPQTNLGKIRVGQTVLIKLDGFPYREYGMLEGRLTSVSATPGMDSAYWGYVELPKKLTTRYRRSLAYRNGLKGQADIITADRSLANRLLTIVRFESTN